MPSHPGPSVEGERLVPGPLEDQEGHGPISPKPTVLGRRGQPLRPARLPPALVLMKTVHELLLIPNYLLWPGWLTCLFCGCQTGRDGSFIKNHTPFKLSFLFCPSFVFANISGLIEHSSPFQPKHMLAFPAQYGNLGI